RSRRSFPVSAVRRQSRAGDLTEEHSLAGLPTGVLRAAWRQTVANTQAHGLAGLSGTPAGVSDQVAPGCPILALCRPLTAQRVCSRWTTGWRFVPPSMPAAAWQCLVFWRHSNFDSAQKQFRLPADEIPRWHLERKLGVRKTDNALRNPPSL